MGRWDSGIGCDKLNCALLLMNMLYQMVCDLRSDLLPKFLSARCALLLSFIAIPSKRVCLLRQLLE